MKTRHTEFPPRFISRHRLRQFRAERLAKCYSSFEHQTRKNCARIPCVFHRRKIWFRDLWIFMNCWQTRETNFWFSSNSQRPRCAMKWKLLEDSWEIIKGLYRRPSSVVKLNSCLSQLIPDREESALENRNNFLCYFDLAYISQRGQNWYCLTRVQNSIQLNGSPII